MQVADIEKAATAATLGAQETQSVGMVQDAAFLMMLSANLYSNQQLACIREPLCNAWDAHIEAGRSDVPLNITITEDNELIIQDSGFGIPDNKIITVYGTYGASTKRTNNQVTGGFGLGSKSPWAYTESFRVISENQGNKVIYNMTRSSIEAQGKPGITKVMELPTERSGLTVSFRLRAEDVELMTQYIRMIAMHGDMLVDFTRDDVTTRLARIEMDTTPGSYDVNGDKWYQPYMGNHTVFVRYGAVIYPMLQTAGTQKAVDLLKQFMDLVDFRRMVVQAAPGTLALTPSREALSSQKMTEDGITDLCVALVRRIEDDLIKQIPASIMTAVERLQDGMNQGLDYHVNVWDAVSPRSMNKYLNSPLGAPKRAKYFDMLKHAEHRGFKKTKVFFNQAATHQYHRMRVRLRDKHWRHKADIKTAFVNHFILRPLSRVFQKNKGLLHLSEMFHSVHFANTTFREKRSRITNQIDVDDFNGIKGMIDSPTVFISSRTRKVFDSIECCPDVLHGGATWLYRIVPKQKDKDAIIKAFTDAGMKVIDLTLNHEWDDVATEIMEQQARRSANRRLSSKTLPGIEEKRTPNALLSLTNVYHDHGTRKMSIGSIKLMKKDGLAKTDKPLFYVPVDALSREGKMGLFGYYEDLTEEERKRGVIVRTGTEKNMAIKRGAISVDHYLAQRLWDRVHSKEYAEYMTKQNLLAVEDQHHIQESHVQLMQLIGVKLVGYSKLRTDPCMDRAAALIKSISSSSFRAFLPNLKVEELKHYTDVVEGFKLEKLPFMEMLQSLREHRLTKHLFWSDEFTMFLKNHPEHKAALKSLVVSALKHGKENA